MGFSSNRAASGPCVQIDRLFRQARRQAGLPKELVLYCARHDYGTRVLMRTGNLAAVMKTMGHGVTKKVTTPFATHPKNYNLGKSLTSPAIVLKKKTLHE